MLSSVPLQRSRYPSQTQGSGVATPENRGVTVTESDSGVRTQGLRLLKIGY